MSDKGLKIVWLCEISNQQIHSCISFNNWRLKNILKNIVGRPVTKVRERAIWNTNAIKEFEKFRDIKLTIIFHYAGIRGDFQKFSINGIDYICYRSEDDYLSTSILKIFGKHEKNYYKGRKIVSSFIDDIKPDIVHIIGAENPNYSICALDVPKDIPCVVSLQTLMSKPLFKENYPIDEKSYQYRSSVEQEVLKRSDYIASRIKTHNAYIKEHIKTDAIFLQMPLAVGVDVNVEPSKKEYDFVYFANNINKAADDAIEAFALAYNVKSSLTLNISGSYDDSFRLNLEKRIKELGMEKNVFITGSKQTHDEVIEQIKKSRFAVLPLKVDLISSTVREAMACGLLVLTTITPVTSTLNENRKSVLLSEKGDYQAMADNMLRLVDDEAFASEIRKNAILTVQEKYSNEKFMNMWRKAYYEIVENFKNGTPFSKDVISEE